jgi:acyl-coenzyme A synthetase/AMP-(fatty) acid ligase
MSTVLVIGLQGEPLNPCHPARARQLVRRQRAEVVSTRPYAIRLVSRASPACGTGRSTRPIRLFDEA